MSAVDDGPFARIVSRLYGTRHHELRIGEEDYLSRQQEAVWANETPLSHGHEAQLLQISKMAKPHVTVLLSGEGSDEIFGGYGRYDLVDFHPWAQRAAVRAMFRLLRPLTRGEKRRRLDKFLAFAGHAPTEAILYNASGVLRSHLERLQWAWNGRFAYRTETIERVLASGIRGTPAVMMADQMLYLPSLLDRNDRMTMFASVECRVPYLDPGLVALANRLPDRWRRRHGIGKRVLLQYARRRLPRVVRNRRKLGFGVPMDRWLRISPPMKEAIRNLPDGPLCRNGYVDRTAAAALVERHLRGEEELSAVLWSLLSLDVWMTEFPRRLTAEQAALPAEEAR